MPNSWRPIAGYIHVPSVWVDARPMDFSRVVWPRMIEAVHQRQLKAGFEATMTREGLVCFRFAGTPLDAGPIDPANTDPLQDERLVQLIHARSEVLTFHAACLAMARGEATNSYGHSAANITPAVMIHFDEGLTNPASMDRGLEPTAAHYACAEALRKLRNDFVHDLGAISPSDRQRGLGLRC